MCAERSPARGYTDLPTDRRAAVDAAVGNRPQQRQAQLEALGAQSAGARGKARTPPVTNPERPTPNDCREYQANWLLSQRTAQGNQPPDAGQPPALRRTRSLPPQPTGAAPRAVSATRHPHDG